MNSRKIFGIAVVAIIILGAGGTLYFLSPGSPSGAPGTEVTKQAPQPQPSFDTNDNLDQAAQDLNTVAK